MIPIAPKRLTNLIAADALNISRDPMLMLGVVMVLIVPTLLAVFGPAIDSAAISAFGLLNLSAILAACALVLCGALIGWVVGFLLIEDRDDNVLVALEVTPVGKTGFIAYRLAMGFFLAFFSALIGAAITLGALSPLAILGASLLAGLHAIATALFLLAFAANKVEGLALTKLINLTILAPALVLLPAPWRYGAAIVPPSWVGEIAGLAASPLPVFLATSSGLSLYVFAVVLLYRRFATRPG